MKKVINFIGMNTMLKILVIVLISLVFTSAKSQIYNNPNPGLYGIKYNRGSFDSSLLIPTGCGVPTDSTFLHDKTKWKKSAKYYDSCGHLEYSWDPALKIWKQTSSDSATFLTHTQGDAAYVRIQTQNPTATLSGGFSYERHASGTFTPTLSYSAGRLAAGSTVNATNPLSSIVVAGITETFSQPSAGGSVSGTQSVTVTYNTNTSFTNTVTTTDSKTASASTSFTVYDKRYIGWAATSTPTSAEILAAVYQDNSGGNASISTTLSVLVTAKYLFIVNTVNESSITVNGFPSTAAFSLNNSISFTNASGGTFTGKYTVSNAPIGNAGSTTLIIN